MSEKSSEAFDLDAACHAAGSDVAWLAIESGVSEERLRAHAAGVGTLSGQERLRVMHSILGRVQGAGGAGLKKGHAPKSLVLHAVRTISDEAEEEERQHGWRSTGGTDVVLTQEQVEEANQYAEIDGDDEHSISARGATAPPKGQR